MTALSPRLANTAAEYLESVNAHIVRITDYGYASGVRVQLSNGTIGTGYYPAWGELTLNKNSFKPC